MAGRIGLSLALVVSFCPLGVAAQPPAAASDPELRQSIARIRAATDAYHVVAAARAADYQPSEQCVQNATGVMGHHHINTNLYDDRLDIERPEILVYAPSKDGGRLLTGVEYVVPYTAWKRDEAPRILGQNLKRADGLGIWYLHVWVWAENPNGLFADWNPALSCKP